MNGCNKKQYRPTVDDTKVPCSTYMSTDCIYPGDKVRVESLGLSLIAICPIPLTL